MEQKPYQKAPSETSFFSKILLYANHPELLKFNMLSFQFF